MKYLKPYNEAIKKLNHKSSDNKNDEVKVGLKVNKLINSDAIYNITKEDYDLYFWENLDIYILCL